MACNDGTKNCDNHANGVPTAPAVERATVPTQPTAAQTTSMGTPIPEGGWYVSDLHEDGQMWERVSDAEGIAVSFKRWDKEGQLQFEEVLDNGKIKRTTHHKTGNVRTAEEVFGIDGKFISARYLGASGELVQASSFSPDGIGLVEKYDKNGVFQRKVYGAGASELRILSLEEWHKGGGEQNRVLARRTLYDGQGNLVSDEGWHEGGEPSWKTTYVNGQMNFDEHWYRDGSLETQSVFDDDGELRSETSWYEDGRKRSEDVYHTDGGIHTKQWDENGGLALEVAPLRDGGMTKTEYYDNGRPKISITLNREQKKVFHMRWNYDGSVIDESDSGDTLPPLPFLTHYEISETVWD